MPIYQYVCEQCHKELELIQKFGEGAPEFCPLCKAKNSMAKIVSSSSFHLKGGGWYKDLYASKKEKTSSTDETKSSSKTAQDKQKDAKVKKED